mgnify:CR=1 FL=1
MKQKRKDMLYEENQNNIIGMYIRQISEMDISDELKAKALGYGMKALLETRWDTSWYRLNEIENQEAEKWL